MFKINKIISNSKILYQDKNIIYIAKGYRIFKSYNDGVTWEFEGKVVDKKYSFLSIFSRLLNRLLRIEISNMYILEDGSRVVIAKKGIFVAKPKSRKYVKTFNVIRGNKPMNICIDNDGMIFFGEYFLNGKFKDLDRSEVHIYKSEDNAQSWNICYTFPKNTIRHIHGIFYDKYTNMIWITTGDSNSECMIANTSNAFKSINIVKSGYQKYRAVTLLFYKDYIVYGTDTEHEQNYIYMFFRKDNEEKCLQTLQGSVLTATQFGNMAALSTAVEPSKVNNHMYAHIWFSKNGLEWEDIYHAKKDKWSFKYFQFGRILFPHNAITENEITFTGHSLEGIDNKTIICRKF